MIDADIDDLRTRTRGRPIPRGRQQGKPKAMTDKPREVIPTETDMAVARKLLAAALAAERGKERERAAKMADAGGYYSLAAAIRARGK